MGSNAQLLPKFAFQCALQALPHYPAPILGSSAQGLLTRWSLPSYNIHRKEKKKSFTPAVQLPVFKTVVVEVIAVESAGLVEVFEAGMTWESLALCCSLGRLHMPPDHDDEGYL